MVFQILHASILRVGFFFVMVKGDDLGIGTETE